MKRSTRSMVLGWVLGAMVAVGYSAAVAQAAPDRSSGAVREEFHQTYPLSANGTLELKNINGNVSVVGWDRNEVKVDAVKWAWTKERLDEAKIVVEPSADRIAIKTQYPERDLTFSDGDRDNPASVEYRITLPRTAKVDEIKLVNGSLTIDGISGEVRASCVNGRMKATGLGSASRLSAVNGTLEAVFAELPSGTVELHDVNGRMSVTIPSDAQATVKANTVNGSISNNFDLPVKKGRYVGSKLEGQLGNGGTEIALHNVNGRIEILHAEDGRPVSRVTNLLPDTSEEAKF
jgi:DUF4097 and DUF4098 domain-containing protein YvlB